MIRIPSIWVMALLLWPIVMHILELTGLGTNTLVLVPFALLLSFTVLIDGRRTDLAMTPYLMVFLAFLGWTAFNALRSSYQGGLGLTTMATFLAPAALLAPSVCRLVASPHPERINYGFLALPLYLAANVVVNLINGGAILSSYGNVNTLLLNFGILAARMDVMPTLTGPNLIGPLAALSLLSCLTLWKVDGTKRLLLAVLTVVSIYVMVLAETRSALVLVVVGFAMALLKEKWVTALAKLSILLTAISPFTMYWFILAVKGAGITAFDRPGALGSFLGFGTGRDFVWKAAYDVLSTDILALIFGYGQAGHISSGTATLYQFIWPGDLEAHTLHNVVLQTVIDGGLIGLVLFLMVLWMAVTRISRQKWLHPSLRKLAMVSLSLILWVGWWETTGTTYHFDTFAYLCFLLCLALPKLSGSGVVAPVAEPPPALLGRKPALIA